MEKVVAYLAEDGQLFGNANDCHEYEIKEILKEDLKDLIRISLNENIMGKFELAQRDSYFDDLPDEFSEIIAEMLAKDYIAFSEVFNRTLEK